jgi:hypothetical protein
MRPVKALLLLAKLLASLPSRSRCSAQRAGRAMRRSWHRWYRARKSWWRPRWQMLRRYALGGVFLLVALLRKANWQAKHRVMLGADERQSMAAPLLTTKLAIHASPKISWHACGWLCLIADEGVLL